MLPVALVLLLFVLLPASAAADGLPAVGIDANPLSLPDGHVAYVTRSGKQSTRLVERARYGGPLRDRRLRGAFSIPAVAYDGSPGGLSADGRTLVLISPRMRYPRKQTTFAVVDAPRLVLRRVVRLKGDFSFDAISPDGRMMYLIEYSPRNLGDYVVRAYDLRGRRLFGEPVVDPREPGEAMIGAPVTRVAGRDGRWAYTLYQSPKHPFVHALDTERRTAVCIDLDDLSQVWGARLELRGPRLEVVGRAGRVRATIDTRTHRLVKPAAPRTEDAGTSWLPLAAPTAALLLALAAFGRRRIGRRRALTAPGTIDG